MSAQGLCILSNFTRRNFLPMRRFAWVGKYKCQACKYGKPRKSFTTSIERAFFFAKQIKQFAFIINFPLPLWQLKSRQISF